VKKLVAAGFSLVLATELFVLTLPDRRLVLWASGIVLAVVLIRLRQLLAQEIRPAPAASTSDDPAASLRRWLSRTETLVGWAESTRSDWDKHLRPMLARQFEMATGQRKAKDPAAFHATGRMLFGEQLWGWVDPDNLTRTGGQEPGPGRAALDEILQRLEQV
jgi:hypothetical protein